MSVWNAAKIEEALSRLRITGAKVFGSETHQFRFNPVIAEAKILAFESEHNIRLPDDYRTFLTSAGNGGAGPSYGIFPLGVMDDNFGLRHWHEEDGMVGDLSSAFPFQEPWNDLAGLPGDLDVEGEDEDDVLQEAFEKRYWNSSLVNGSIPICHEGCAIRILLIVTGPLAGQVWRDARSEYAGLAPVFLIDRSPATFFGWYQEWLSPAMTDAD